MGDIGDGDERDVSAFVCRIGIGSGPHRIVMVARIFRINRHQRDGAQIRAAARIGGRGVLGLLHNFFGKLRRNAVRMNGDQTNGFGRVHAADAFDDARPRETAGASGNRFGQHQFIILCTRAVARIDGEFRAAFAVDRSDADAMA